MKPFFFSLAALVLLSTAACNRDDTPEPDEQELITTLRVIVRPQAGGAEQTFTYKVQNGFGSTSPGTVQIDTLRLSAGAVYNAQLEVLNESEAPAENITEEILAERDDHLFLLVSNPASGAGSIAVSGGNTDNQGRPLNQTVQLTAGAAGSGTLTVTLLHEPTDKAGSTPSAAGGETDLEAIFPARITP